MADGREPMRPDERAGGIRGRARLLQWTLIFLIAAGVAGVFAFGDTRPNVTEVAQGFFFAFLALAIGSFALHVNRRRRGRG